MLKFAKVAANTALVAEIRELLTGSAQFATRAGKKNDPFLYQYLSLGHQFEIFINRSFEIQYVLLNSKVMPYMN